MNVRISAAHRQWHFDQVSSGTFAPVDQAIAWAIEGAIHFTGDEFDWARPFLDQADASLARGAGIAAVRGRQILAEAGHRASQADGIRATTRSGAC